MSGIQKIYVEMLPAFCWTCERCGLENFVRAVTADFSPEELNELRQEHGVNPWEAGEFVQKPNTVTCKGCSSKFPTIDYNAE
jgi:hypothetical protein